MPSIIDTSKLPELVEKHFGEILGNLGYAFSQAKTEGENYFKYVFTYSNKNREIYIDISNNFELINYALFCQVILYKLPKIEGSENSIYPTWYNYKMTHKERTDYDDYLIDQNKNLLDELDRVLANYAKLLFTGD